MKPLRTLLLLPALLLASCVGPGNPFEIIFPTVGVNYGTYNTLPENYNGNAYYYNGRYYSGGRYESGRYYYGGRPYNNRYYHNGRYYYGGRYEYVRPAAYQQNRNYYDNNRYAPPVRRYPSRYY